jgi:hypothetical protein
VAFGLAARGRSSCRMFHFRNLGTLVNVASFLSIDF